MAFALLFMLLAVKMPIFSRLRMHGITGTVVGSAPGRPPEPAGRARYRRSGIRDFEVT
jgi:hypothetical protein